MALVAVIAALAAAAWLFNPVQTLGEQTADVARDVGILPSRCPTGWDDKSEGADHAQIFVCAKGSWRVVLKPDGKTFNHAVELDRPGAVIIYDEAVVPGWSR